MPHERPNEPIAPTKIPPEQAPESDESEQERQARESEKAFDQALTRIPPG